MRLLAIFILLCSSIAFADDKQPPPKTEQAAPAKTAPAPEQSQQQQPPPLPSSTDMTHSYEGAFIRMLVTLLGLVLLVFLTFWILRRLGKGKFSFGGDKMINVIERKSLSPKTSLFIIEIEGKRVLVSESQFEVRALTTIDLPPSE